MDYCPPGSSGHGIAQARWLEWVTISFSTLNQQITEKEDKMQDWGEWDNLCVFVYFWLKT